MHKNLIIIFLFFSLNGYVYCQEDSIYEYFKNKTDTLYYVGIRHFYLGTLFNSRFINNNFEDYYTEVLYIIPVNGEIGICVQGDQNKIIDTFLYAYDPELVKYIQMEGTSSLSLLSHRSNVLEEITKIRFRIMTLNGINSLLLPYNIVLE